MILGLKLCIFSAQYLPTVGGVERYTYNLSKELVKHGASITIVTSQLKDVPDYETMEGIEIYRTPCYSLLKGRFPVVKRNRKFNRIIKDLSVKNFDVVVVNTRFYPLSLEGVKFAKANNIRCMVIEHGTNHLTINNKMLDKFGEKFEHNITNKIKKYCDNFYGVSEACNEWLLHFGIKASGVIYNAVDLNYINKLLSNPAEDYRTFFDIPQSAIIISFIGRFVKEKGVQNLLKAVKLLNQSDKNIYLLMAGDGPLLEPLRSEQTSNIHFLGSLEYPKVISLLKDSDVFCLPSESEGFPTSVLEAVACKNFVVTTYRGGAKELISDGESGTIMKTNSVDEIYESLSKVLYDVSYREEAVQLAYEKLCAQFTWDQVAKNLIQDLSS